MFRPLLRSFCFIYSRRVYNASAAIKKDAERKEGEGAAKVKVDNLNANHTFVPPHVTCHLSRTNERDESSWKGGDVTLHNRKKTLSFFFFMNHVINHNSFQYF